MSDSPSQPSVQPGATYRFLVRTAEEAVQTIRERLGEDARVLSVRQVGSTGMFGLFGRARLEVIAQAASETPPAEVLGATDAMASSAGPTLARSDEVALPPRFVDDSVASLQSPARARAEAAGIAGSAARLPELLRRSGFSESMIGRLSTTPLWQGLEQRPLHQALSEMGQTLRRDLEKRPVKPLPARTAFLGTPGVGRTTALCKWLARDVFARGRAARVIKAEFDRPNPAEGLSVFCEALGVPVDYVTPELPEVEIDHQGLVYADLPSLSLKSPAENQAVAKFLQQEEFAGRILVLNAAYDQAMLRKSYAVGRDLGATHLVFTHLDEVEHWGRLWDFLLDAQLQPLFFATGPSLTGDCEEDVVNALMRKTLPGG